MKCLKWNDDNPDSTLQIPVINLSLGAIFAGRYRIIEELVLTHIAEAKERFMREAQAAAILDYPNIYNVHEFDSAEEKTFISMAILKDQA